MSEVKFYALDQQRGGDCSWFNLEDCKKGEAEYVGISDFDRVTAERDAALTSLDSVDASAQTLHEVITRLQHRLTAADERADALDVEWSRAITERGLLGLQVDVLEAVSVKQAALLDELGIPLDEVDDLFGETLKNAKRYEYLRLVMAVENFPTPHPEWSEPSEVESKRIDDLCDAALKPAEGGGDEAI